MRLAGAEAGPIESPDVCVHDPKMPSARAPTLRACVALLALGVSACEPESRESAPVGAARQLLSTVPLVSQEIDIDAPVLVRSRDSQYSPAAASDGFGYLVVWNDFREGGGIWASRLDANGTLLDKTGIIVRKGPWNVEPQVAFDGSSYVVLWGSQGATPIGLYAVRLKPDGSVLDDPPITLSLAGSGGQITRSPSGSLVVFNESSSVYVRRIAEDGTLPDGSPQAVAINGYAPDVAFDGSTYLVVWQSGSNLRASRLSHSLVPLDSTPLLVASATGAAWPSVAAGSSGFLVSWSDYSGQVRVSRVKADGSVLDPGGVPLTSAGYRSDVGFDGAAHLVVSASTSLLGVAGTRVGPAGLTDKPLLISSGEGVDRPRIASRPGEHLVVWESAFGGGVPTDISGRRVAADGTLLGAAALDFALSANEQLAPVVASDGTDFLLVWQDHRNPAGPDLYAERVSATGGVLDPIAIPLAGGPKSQKEPEISFDGTQYLLVWEEEDDVRGARVDKAGKLLDAGGFPIASSTSAERDPAIASNGGVSLVAWTHGGSSPDVHAARVDSTGKLLDPGGLVVADGAGSQRSAAVASDGIGFCVTWLHNPSSGGGSGGGGKLNWGSVKSPDYEIRASLIASSGTPLTSSPVVVVPMGERGVPRVAFGGGVYLVVWADGRHSAASSADSEIYAARVTTSGTVLDPNGIRVTELPGPDALPDVSWKGDVFIVGWIADDESRAARIDATGLVLDPGGFIVSPVADWAKPIRVASNAAGTTLAGYERYDSAPVFRSRRTRARTISFVAAPDSGVAGDAAAEAVGATEDAPVLDVADGGETLDVEPVIDSDAQSDLDAAAGEAGTTGLDGTNGLGGSAGGSSSATEPTEQAPSEEDSGCGCEMPRSAPTIWPLATLALAMLLVGRRLRPE